jgi:hypothetical protein
MIVGGGFVANPLPSISAGAILIPISKADLSYTKTRKATTRSGGKRSRKGGGGYTTTYTTTTHTFTACEVQAQVVKTQAFCITAMEKYYRKKEAKRKISELEARMESSNDDAEVSELQDQIDSLKAAHFPQSRTKEVDYLGGAEENALPAFDPKLTLMLAGVSINRKVWMLRKQDEVRGLLKISLFGPATSLGLDAVWIDVHELHSVNELVSLIADVTEGEYSRSQQSWLRTDDKLATSVLDNPFTALRSHEANIRRAVSEETTAR